MPDLRVSLLDRDIGFLRICASLWGVELTNTIREKAAEELVGLLLDPQVVRDGISDLPLEARAALQALIQSEGRMTWAVFTRQWGQVRLVGPGRRDREQTHLQPVSPAEILVNRSLVANAFFDSPSGLQEYAYIPQDMLPVIRKILEKDSRGSAGQSVHAPPGRPATSRECSQAVTATDFLLDDAVTLLAAMRLNMAPPGLNTPTHVVADFLRSAGILEGNDPSPEKVRDFLGMSPGQSLEWLEEAWLKSESFNELRQLPGLLFEGDWLNHPLAARRFLIDLVHSIPVDQWWSLTALVAHIKEKNADFQRPAGDYDSWYIKRVEDGTYLRGFGTWDEVDGALIRYLVTGPLFWLGLVDIAHSADRQEITSFRRRKMPPTRQETARLSVTSNGLVSVPRYVPRFVRYQVSRFCEWKESKRDDYRYQATVPSLQRAAAQGLKINQLLSLLSKNTAAGLPPAFTSALKRWESKGTEARLQAQVLLRLSRPEVLEELRLSKAGRFLGEVVGPTTVVIKPGAEEKVVSALWNLGILAEMVSLD